jgi:hypothetical protein
VAVLRLETSKRVEYNSTVIYRSRVYPESLVCRLRLETSKRVKYNSTVIYRSRV